MSDAVPFDGEFSAQVESAIKLASTDGLGRELARRAMKYERFALEAKERARMSSDLVAVGAAAEAAGEAATWCARFAAAAVQLLGSGDFDTSTRCHALTKAAWDHASFAEIRFALVKRQTVAGAVPHA